MITADPDSSADIFAFSCDQISALTGKEVLAPVKESISKFVTQENDASSVKVGSVYGQLVAFPEESYNGYGLVYNRSIVSDADASTIEGVLAACKKAGKQFIMDCGNGFYSSMFAFTGGVTIDGFEEDGITQKFSNYDEDEAVATLMAFAKLMKDYKGTLVSQDPAHISTGFLNGKVGAGIDGSWNLAADKSALGSNFGVAKLPTINVNGALPRRRSPIICQAKPASSNALTSWALSQPISRRRLRPQTFPKYRRLWCKPNFPYRS